MNKLPFTHFLLEVLKASAKKHGLTKPLTIGHLLGIVVLATKLNKKHNGKVNRVNRHPDLEPPLETAEPEQHLAITTPKQVWMRATSIPKVDNG